MTDSVKDFINKWLIEESFIVSKLDAPPEARIKWGLNISTSGTPGIRFTIINPLDKPDRMILAMGIMISTEHRREIEKAKLVDRVRAMHSILSRALSVCIDCKIAVQPSIIDPQTITVNMEIFEEEILNYGKPYFLRLVARFLNTYLAIVSGFNEWFPVIPTEEKGRLPSFI
ncbi:MAG: DUF2299 family protein [Desulfurococcaceae archaeon]